LRAPTRARPSLRVHVKGGPNLPSRERDRRAEHKLWREKNRERWNAYVRAWRKRNPEYNRLWSAFDRDRRRNGPCPDRIDLATWKKVRAAFGERCCYCGSAESLQIEHLTPIARGGRSMLGNLALACAGCNAVKMTQTAEEFRPDRAEEIRRVARLEPPGQGPGAFPTALRRRSRPLRFLPLPQPDSL
jgi:5-methylcytosine-specific restriction endonuclease McrA